MGAIYYPVADYSNPAPYYPTDDTVVYGADPTGLPTSEPSGFPTGSPTSQPTKEPIGPPTTVPSSEPTSRPSLIPSVVPSVRPTVSPRPTVARRHRALANDDHAQAATDDGGKLFPLL